MTMHDCAIFGMTQLCDQKALTFFNIAYGSVYPTMVCKLNIGN